MPGTGYAGMGTRFVSRVEGEGKVPTLVNGVPGRRMRDVVGRRGAEVDVMEFT